MNTTKILTTPCNHCVNSRVIEENGVKRIVCKSEELLSGLRRDEMLRLHRCSNYIPTEEQKQHDEFVELFCQQAGIRRAKVK